MKKTKKVQEYFKYERYHGVTALLKSPLVVLLEAKYLVFVELRRAGVSLAEFPHVIRVCRSFGKVVVMLDACC